MSRSSSAGLFRSIQPMVLIVEDHPDTAAIVVEYLAHHGARSICATGVADARQILEALPIDVVVTDYSMPDEDGLAFLRGLRADERFTSLPVVMISGHDCNGEIADAAIAQGAVFVPKPFDLDAIATAVHSVLRAAGLAVDGEPATAIAAVARVPPRRAPQWRLADPEAELSRADGADPEECPPDDRR